MAPSARIFLLLIMVLPFNGICSECAPAVIRQMFTVTRKATKR